MKSLKAGLIDPRNSKLLGLNLKNRYKSTKGVFCIKCETNQNEPSCLICKSSSHLVQRNLLNQTIHEFQNNFDGKSISKIRNKSGKFH